MVAMFFYHCRPSAPLDAFVDCFWFYEGGAAAHAQERVLPSGTADIVISLNDDPFSLPDRRGGIAGYCDGALISGPQSEFFVIDTAEKANVLGVHFKPGGAAPFLRLPADAVCDRHVALEDIWGSLARRLRERLQEAKGIAARCAILEAALLQAARRQPRPCHSTVAHALHVFATAPEMPRMGDMARRLEISQRRFIQLFGQEVGLTPKLYGRIRRFRGVLEMLEAEQDIAWADVAAACGYYDQAHFIRDFRAFAGITPRMYQDRRVDGEFNHLVHA